MPDSAAAVRKVYERWAEGDFRAGGELFDREVVFILGPGLGPDTGTFHGRDGVASYMRAFLDAWERVTITAEEIELAGDSVIVTVHQRGLGRQSGIETGLRYFQVWSFRGETVIRLESFRERDEAREACGLAR